MELKSLAAHGTELCQMSDSKSGWIDRKNQGEWTTE